MNHKNYLRLFDANLNRSREGLRVCEDICRFVADDKTASLKLKRIRHAITNAFKGSEISVSELLLSRDSSEDVGKRPSQLENSKKDTLDLFMANLERTKEALRVLEEVSKLQNQNLSKKFKRIRFDVYTAEKRLAPKLEALCRDRKRAAGRRGQNA